MFLVIFHLWPLQPIQQIPTSFCEHITCAICNFHDKAIFVLWRGRVRYKSQKIIGVLFWCHLSILWLHWASQWLHSVTMTAWSHHGSIKCHQDCIDCHHDSIECHHDSIGNQHLWQFLNLPFPVILINPFSPFSLYCLLILQCYNGNCW